jgi:hypothetical protein
MKIHPIFAVVGLTLVLSGCASSSSQSGPPPTPTPMSQKIDVVSSYHMPAHYVVVGNVMGDSISMLKKRARELGADAIVNPRKVDPVSGWATTQAIKYTK